MCFDDTHLIDLVGDAVDVAVGCDDGALPLEVALETCECCEVGGDLAWVGWVNDEDGLGGLGQHVDFAVCVQHAMLPLAAAGRDGNLGCLVPGRHKGHIALSDQGDPSTYTLHGAYYLKDRDSRSKVW